MTAIFFFGGLIVTIYLWVYQASKLLTKSYILIESEGTDSKVYEWLEVWLPKEKLLNETPTDFLWSMDLNPMKKNAKISQIPCGETFCDTLARYQDLKKYQKNMENKSSA